MLVIFSFKMWVRCGAIPSFLLGLCSFSILGFEFLGPGRQRVRVFGPWVPEGSCFLDSERQRVRVLARVRPRVRVLGVVRERVRLRVPVLKNYGLQKIVPASIFTLQKCQFRTTSRSTGFDDPRCREGSSFRAAGAKGFKFLGSRGTEGSRF